MLKKLGYRLSCLRSEPFDFAITYLAKIGYRGVELCLEHPDLNPGNPNRLKVDNVRKALMKNDIVATTVSFHTKNAGIEIKREKSQYGIRLAKELGVKTFISGAPLSTKNNTEDEMFGFADEMCEFSGELGIDFALETEPGTLLHDYQSVKRLLQTLNRSNLKINFDIGHFYITEDDVVETIKLCANRIVHTHIEDIKDKKHQHLMPGEGDINLGEIFRAFDNIGYSGYFVLDMPEESENPKTLAKSAYQAIHKFIEK
jgi:sugar phosphate isomerase/epimerase